MEFQTIQQRLALALTNHAQRTALTDGKRTLSYAQLAQRAQFIAADLKAQGLGVNDTVALILDNPLDTCVAIAGVLLLGARYALLSPALAPFRLRSIFARHRMTALVSAATLSLVEGFAPTRLLADGEGAGDDFSPAAANPGDVVAVAYASDASGRLEGLRITQANLGSFIDFNTSKARLGLERMLLISDHLDDLGVFALLAAWSYGGTVACAPASALTAALAQQQPQTVVTTLATLETLGAENLSLPGVRHLLTSGQQRFPGEALKEALKAQQIVWHNYYGFPALQMLTVLVETATEHGTRAIHSGKPAPQTKALILDQNHQLLSVGLAGELYVTGPGVFAGYLDDDHLSNTRFIESPLVPGERLFQTRYLARWQDNGRIDIVDELDPELLYAGTPLKLQELEALMLSHALVKGCAVVRRQAVDNPATLTAFIVAQDEIHPAVLEDFILRHLAVLPPALGFLQLGSLPCTKTGAVDRRLLAETSLLDSRQIADLQARLQQEAHGADVAVIAKTVAETLPAIHVSDVLPAFEDPVWGTSQATTAAEVVEVAAHDRVPALAVGGPILTIDAAPLTLTEALSHTARLYPDHGITYVKADGGVLRQSYPELLAEAERILGGLRAANLAPGAHVLFQFPKNEDFVPAFWACMLGGFVAVPLSVPTAYERANAVVAKLHNAWQTLDHPLIVTDMDNQATLRATFAAIGDEQPTIMTIEALRRHAPATSHHQTTPQETALLLLTSGSTGMPKGVVLTHHNIVSRSKSSAQHNGFHAGDCSLNWMPLDHVGGIVMFHIRDMCAGCDQIQVKTDYILEDPVRWLDLIEQYKATITWAPNFAYALIKDHQDRVNSRQRDLSSMRFILNGGEGINKQTALSFLALLQEHGLPTSAMHPAYGMSETSSGIAFSDRLILGANTGFHELDQSSLQGLVRPATADGIGVSFVEVGEPLPGVSLRIVNAANEVLSEDMIGRLQAKGPTITPGYYRNPELNAETFTEDGWFTTGDLAFLHQGRLTITGREKDVIIINGVNYHNHEIEALVETIEDVEVSYTAACSVPSQQRQLTESLVVFYCSKHEDFAAQMRQSAEIREAIAQKIGINPSYVLPVDKDAIPKTAIGKIQRSQLSKRFADGEFAAITRKIDLFTANEQTLQPWFFTRTWEPELAGFDPQALKASYAVLSDNEPLARELIERLELQDRPCVLVMPGPGFAKLDERTYTINVAERADYGHLVAALDTAGIRDFVHLYTCELPAEIGTRAELEAAQQHGVLSLLFLTQALAERSENPASLAVVSRWSHAINTSDPVVYAAATLHGFLKTAPLEIGWLTCQHIDLDDADPVASSLRIYQELGRPAPQPEVAYRQGQRLAPRLIRADIRQEQPIASPIIKGGLYLLTGGLGGIGSQFARWLIETYDACLIITGSTELPDRSLWKGLLAEDSRLGKRLRTYKELTDISDKVLYAAIDITDPAQIETLIAQGEVQWGQPLAGAFHFAGAGNLEYHWTVMDRHWITAETPDTFAMMFAPKVYGTWALRQALHDRPELQIVTMSSVNSLFGGATFSAYSAANSFLDCFTLYQRHTTHPGALCLNWTQWDNIGMSHNNPQQIRGLAESRGYATIDVRQGIRSFLAGICQQAHSFLVVGLNGESPAVRALVDHPLAAHQVLAAYVSNGADSVTQERCRQLASAYFGQSSVELHRVTELPRLADGSLDLAALAQLEPGAKTKADDQPTNVIEQQVHQIWQEILGKQGIGIHDNFFALGGHSLLATQLVSRLRDTFNLEVRLYQLFAAPTVAELAATIAQLQLEQIGDAEMEALFAELADLPEDETQASVG